MKFWKITFFVVIILGLNQGVCSKDSEEPGDHSEENTTEDETGSAESEDEIMEDQTNLAEREVKSPPSEQEKRATMEKFTKAFLKAMTHGLLLATPAGHFFGMAVAIVSFAVGEATKQGKNLWKVLEDKITIKIGKKLAGYHLDRLYAELFPELEGRIKKKNFDAEDLDEMLWKRRMVFPQNYGSLGYSESLPVTILYWMPFVIAGYQKLINDSAKDPCSLANEMSQIRSEIITACKAMIRKRYQEVHGTSWSRDRVNYKRYGIVFGGGSRKKVRVSLDDVLTFADGLTGKTFIVRKRGYSGFVGSENWYTHINRIRDETVDFLWKELVHKTNQFFTDAICLKSTGCKCPNPITKSEIRFSYPKGCFGHWKCLHPCGRFGYSYDWCCENGELDYNYDCRPPNWDSCMKVNTPTVNPPNVLKKPPKGTSKKSE